MFTYIIIGSVLAVIIAGTYILSKMNANTRDSEDAIAQARERAAKRLEERRWADTKPEVDPWSGRLDLSALNNLEVDDRFDGRGKLDPDQKRTINIILEGVDVNYIDSIDSDNYVFSEANKVETVNSGDVWNSRYNRE